MYLNKIRRIEILANPYGAWSKREGNIRFGQYKVEPKVMDFYRKTAKTFHDDIPVIFERDYPKDVQTKTIWHDIRVNMKDNFFITFYPSIVRMTSPNLSKVYAPEGALQEQSWHIKQRVQTNPEQYHFNKHEGKWVISPRGYQERTELLGGEIQVGLGYELGKGEAAVEHYMRNVKDKEITIPLFVYPDKYDEKIRASFLLIMYFY